MKKLFAMILIMIIVIMSFVGCNTSIDNNSYNSDNVPDTTVTDEISNSETSTELVYISPMVYKCIDMQSFDEFLKMKQVLLAEDEEQIKEYLSGSSNLINGKEDLEMFLDLAERLPAVNAVDGELCWIYYCDSDSIDTGVRCQVFYISFMAEDGAWIRFEYVLSPGITLSDETKEEFVPFESHLTGANGRIALLSERKKPHPSGVGEFVTWVANVDGVDTFIHQYSPYMDQIKVDPILNGDLIKVSDIKNSESVGYDSDEIVDLAKQIKISDTQNTVEKILGKGSMIGSGEVIYQWEYSNGDSIIVDFYRDLVESSGFLVYSVRVNSSDGTVLYELYKEDN